MSIELKATKYYTLDGEVAYLSKMGNIYIDENGTQVTDMSMYTKKKPAQKTVKTEEKNESLQTYQIIIYTFLLIMSAILTLSAFF